MVGMVEPHIQQAVALDSVRDLQLQPSGGRTYEIIAGALGRILAAAGLAALSPLWLVIAVAIKLTSAGPVLFRAPVVGLNGRVFEYYKFRTMYEGGDNAEHVRWIEAFVRGDRPYGKDQSGLPVYKVIDDPRVTPIGRWLRRFSIDEIPQLINVLRGDMYVIGPRPPVIYEYDLYGPKERRRLAVKPGMTGLYQIQKRGRASFSEMLALDLEYIRRRSLWLDLQILFKTPWVVLIERGIE